jgi:hypothetical protein
MIESELDQVIDEIQKYQITDTKTIRERKKKVLQNIVIDSEEMKHYQTLLLDYRYVDEIDELRMGSYLRFFRLNTDSLNLGRGGFLADIKMINHSIVLLLKNRNLFFHLKMDECILFQKNTKQEEVLIQILDHIKG